MSQLRSFREKLQKKLPLIGTWLQLPSPDAAEIIASLGYDFLVIDMEHGSFSRSQLANMFRAIECRQVLPFVRLLEANMSYCKAALDAGAQGIIFPMIESGKQLERAISYTLYPGLGQRGVGFARSNMYGKEFAEGLKRNEELIIVAQIEHINALDELDAIFSQKRLDAYMIGPYDLSASMGLTGQFMHPEFIKVLVEIEKKAAEYKVPKGYHIVQANEEELQAKINQEYSFIVYGIDTLFLQSAKRPQL